jgi:hypothetical protein
MGALVAALVLWATWGTVAHANGTSLPMQATASFVTAASALYLRAQTIGTPPLRGLTWEPVIQNALWEVVVAQSQQTSSAAAQNYKHEIDPQLVVDHYRDHFNQPNATAWDVNIGLANIKIDANRVRAYDDARSDKSDGEVILRLAEVVKSSRIAATTPPGTVEGTLAFIDSVVSRYQKGLNKNLGIRKDDFDIKPEKRLALFEQLTPMIDALVGQRGQGARGVADQTEAVVDNFVRQRPPATMREIFRDANQVAQEEK